MGLLTKNKYVPYGPTCKWYIYNCLMGLLAKNKYMPHGPTCKQYTYTIALWAYLQRINMCLMGLLTNDIYMTVQLFKIVK